MLSIVIAMVVVVVVAGLVLFYVAFPHRGESPGSGEWLGSAMTRAKGRMPTLDETDGDASVRPRPGDQDHGSAT